MDWDNVTFNQELYWSYVLIFLIKFDFPLKKFKDYTTLTLKRGLFKPEYCLGSQNLRSVGCLDWKIY